IYYEMDDEPHKIHLNSVSEIRVAKRQLWGIFLVSAALVAYPVFSILDNNHSEEGSDRLSMKSEKIIKASAIVGTIGLTYLARDFKVLRVYHVHENRTETKYLTPEQIRMYNERDKNN
ncbi:MAG: hypothetical protein RIF46_04505, partial [Cyclobacteriaceae bacterium]